jgi:hypothetical protein
MSAVELIVEQVLELGPVTVDKLTDASREVDVGDRGHGSSGARPRPLLSS